MLNPYETDKYLAEYLLFHYGTREEILPYPFGPFDALYFPVRCVTQCLDYTQLSAEARALDLGCAVGRSSFELTRFCASVLGIDRSSRFIQAATLLAEQGHLSYTRTDEGYLTTGCIAIVPEEIDRQKVTFAVGDALHLPGDIGRFDVVLMANLLDRLTNPRQCLAQMVDLINPNGQLIITSPYTWLEEFTPVHNWLGGIERMGERVSTLDSLRHLLEPTFELLAVKELPFLLREHARKYQWSIAQASLWMCRDSR